MPLIVSQMNVISKPSMDSLLLKDVWILHFSLMHESPKWGKVFYQIVESLVQNLFPQPEKCAYFKDQVMERPQILDIEGFG